jgi:hypothetical protein
VYLAVHLMRGVTFDEPLRYKISTFREEVGRKQRVRPEGVTEWVMPWPKMAELPPGAVDLMRSREIASGPGDGT